MGYTETMNMAGAADVHLYPRDVIIAPHVEILTRNMARAERTNMNQEYSSFYDFRQSIKITKPKVVIDVGKMTMRNAAIASLNEATDRGLERGLG